MTKTGTTSLCSVVEVCRAIDVHHDPEKLCRELAQQLTRLFPITGLRLVLFREITGSSDWTFVHEDTETDPSRSLPTNRLKKLAHELQSSTLLTEEAWLVVPLRSGCDVAGVLTACLPQKKWGAQQDDFLNAIGCHVGVVLERLFLRLRLEHSQDDKSDPDESRKVGDILSLVRSFAHEMNQPLTGISGYCSLIRETLDSSSALAHDLKEIQKQADRLESLIHQFQDLVNVDFNQRKSVN